MSVRAKYLGVGWRGFLWCYCRPLRPVFLRVHAWRMARFWGRVDRDMDRYWRDA